MKKLFVLIAILLICAVPYAQAFFTIADPFTTDGAANVKVPVYNNSGGALTEGAVVVWQIGSSTGDNDLYVTTTTTADTALVAGVVAQGGIASASSGAIVVYGMAQCDTGANSVGDGGQLCTSTQAGTGANCSTAANESFSYAITSAAIGSNSQGNCFVGGK